MVSKLSQQHALLLARKVALDAGQRDPKPHDYLPTTEEEAKAWSPHEWVVEALMRASDPEIQHMLYLATRPPIDPSTITTVHGRHQKVYGEPDHYVVPGSMGEGRGHPYRACSWCGSCHPEDLARELRGGSVKLSLADMKYGWPHKFYIAGRAPFEHAKFYAVHLKDANAEDRNTIERAMGLHYRFDTDGGVRWWQFGTLEEAAFGGKGNHNAQA